MIEATGTLLLTQAPVILFGFAIALLPSLRRVGLLSRLVLAWLSGVTLIALLAPLLSLAGAWGERSLAIPLLIAAIASPVAARRRAHAARLLPEPASSRPDSTSVVLMICAFALLAFQVTSGRAIPDDIVGYDVAKAARWAEHAIDPSTFNLADPAAPPLQATTLMWSEMLQRDSATGSALWLPIALLLVFVVLARAPINRLLEGELSWLAMSATVLTMALAIIASRSVGSGELWILMLAPLTLVVVSSPGTPIMYVVPIVAATTVSHRAGIFIAAAAVLVELMREQKRRAMWIGAASLAVITPWWLLLAVNGYAPWSGTLRAPEPGWSPFDPALIVMLVVSVLLVASRWRRGSYLAPVLMIVAVLVAYSAFRSPETATGVLLSVRMCAPLLVSAACLLCLRPLRGPRESVPMWRR